MLKNLKANLNNLPAIVKTFLIAGSYFVLQFFLNGEGNKIITGQPILTEKFLINLLSKMSSTVFLGMFLPFYFSKSTPKRYYLFFVCFISYLCVIPVLIFPKVNTISIILIILGYPLTILISVYFNFYMKNIFGFDIFDPKWTPKWSQKSISKKEVF